MFPIYAILYTAAIIFPSLAQPLKHALLNRTNYIFKLPKGRLISVTNELPSSVTMTSQKLLQTSGGHRWRRCGLIYC